MKFNKFIQNFSCKRRHENMKISRMSGAGVRELYQLCYKTYVHRDQQDRLEIPTRPIYLQEYSLF